MTKTKNVKQVKEPRVINNCGNHNSMLKIGEILTIASRLRFRDPPVEHCEYCGRLHYTKLGEFKRLKEEANAK